MMCVCIVRTYVHVHVYIHVCGCKGVFATSYMDVRYTPSWS